MADQLRTFETDRAVLVCGLGRVGRQCVEALRGYNVPVRTIDLCSREELGSGLDESAFTQGDFRDLATLLRAGVGGCRSIALLSNDANANIEGALAARRANSAIRVVVRGQEHGWHQLLAAQLGNLVVYEPNRLAAPTFALAALDTEVLAHFYVDSQLFQVLEHEVTAHDRWIGQRIDEIHPPGRQILSHARAGATRSGDSPFYGWEPDTKIAAGDQLLLLKTDGSALFSSHEVVEDETPLRTKVRRWMRALSQLRLQRPGQLALLGLAALAGLIVLASFMFSFGSLRLQPLEALRVSISLLFGGHFADIFESYEQLPAAAHWLELALVIAGTVLTAVMYALLTDLLLRARIDLSGRRPGVPQRGHVIVADLGQTGIRIAGLLEQLECKVVAIDSGTIQPHVLPRVPLVTGDPTLQSVLLDANLKGARGIVCATSDDQTNVEMALTARQINARCPIAVRTFDPRFRENVAFLLPGANVLCASTLAASVYAAAALGEHVIHLFNTAQAPVLVVEYTVAADDTLVGKALWQVAEGYAVVPVMHGSAGRPAKPPSRDDGTIKLHAGDRFVVLATQQSLEWIERGLMRPAQFQLKFQRMRAYAESVQIAGLLCHWLGYSLEQGHAAIEHLPHLTPLRLYGRYAMRAAKVLDASGLETRVVRAEEQEAAV
jgi:Trk K+ transport system NAD-binding subunit